MSHQARGRLKGTQYERLLERARAKERARATADVLYVEQDVAGQHNTCVPFTSEARSHRYHNISTQHHNTTCDKNEHIKSTSRIGTSLQLGQAHVGGRSSCGLRQVR